MVQNAVASIRNLFLLPLQQMIMLPPPGIHNRNSFFFPPPCFLSLFRQLPFLALCCDQVFIISLAISHFLYPLFCVSPTASASLMCILSYAYLLQVCVLSYFCSNPSFLGADRGHSLRVLATLFVSIPVFIVCHILDGPFHSLSITLLFVLRLHSFRPPLRKCVVYRLPSVCLYGPLVASQPNLCASNLQS